MALYTKSDMVYGDYNWTVEPVTNPYLTGRPESVILNRHEGNEVLHMINKLAGLWDIEERSDVQKMERMIHDHLPSGVRSHDNVIEWMEENWNFY